MLVAIGIGEAGIEHLGPALDLGAPDLRPLLELLLDDEVLEPARADHVGALAHQDGPVVVRGVKRFDAAHRRCAGGGGPARRASVGETREGGDVRGGSPAATADRIDPAFLDEPPLVASAVVGQARVRIHGDEARGDLAERAQVIGHELGAGCAVEPDGEEVEMLQ